MTNSDDMQTPPRVRGANNVTPADGGATVTPPATRNNTTTNVQSDEERSTNGEAQAAMDVETKSGNKRGQAVYEENPVAASTAKTAKPLWKLKERKAAARRQSTNSFAGIKDGTKPRTPPTKRADESAARKSAATRTQTMINQKEEFT